MTEDASRLRRDSTRKESLYRRYVVLLPPRHSPTKYALDTYALWLGTRDHSKGATQNQAIISD